MYVAKTKALLICSFVLEYAKIRFSHDSASTHLECSLVCKGVILKKIEIY